MLVHIEDENLRVLPSSRGGLWLLGYVKRMLSHNALLTVLTEKEIEIYVCLTDMQRKRYQSVLEKNIDTVNRHARCPFRPKITIPILRTGPSFTLYTRTHARSSAK
jgi:hypothetical protein